LHSVSLSIQLLVIKNIIKIAARLGSLKQLKIDLHILLRAKREFRRICMLNFIMLQFPIWRNASLSIPAAFQLTFRVSLQAPLYVKVTERARVVFHFLQMYHIGPFIPVWNLSLAFGNIRRRNLISRIIFRCVARNLRNDFYRNSDHVIGLVHLY
jgi:hypothetical protein